MISVHALVRIQHFHALLLPKNQQINTMLKHLPRPINKQNKTVFSNSIASPLGLNNILLSAFLRLQNETNVRKTHLFDGRYENIYLNAEHIPQLTGLMKAAVKSASAILKTENLRAGFWFNYMPPDSTTTLHTHDDDDELLSAVYYVYTPENSGNLILFDDSADDTNKIEIIPKAGNFIFFKPDVPHEVSKNNSNEHRLSIGINFGMDK